jgi:DNA primase
MLSWEIIKEFCFKNLDQPKEHRSHKINARCPFCGDSKKSKIKKRLWVTFKDEEDICIFHCFNCNESGSFYKIYAFIENINEKEAREKFESTQVAIDHIKNTLLQRSPIIIKSEEKEIKNFNWIRDYCFKSDEEGYAVNIALKRLKEFRTERLIPDWVDLFIAFRDPYTGRIIIPIYNENKNIIYFQARSLAKNPTNKYLNPVADKILKQDLSKHKDPLIVTEGLIDSFMLPGHGVPSLGAFISDEFLEYLFQHSSDIIIALDNDSAGYKSLNRILNESKYAYKLKWFLMPKEYSCINDLNKLKMLNNNINIIEFVIKNSVSTTTVKILLKLDTWRNPL